MTHLETARKVLLFEATQIIKIAEQLTEEFNRVVEIILQSDGKIIICGLGKSGSIAEKITATFCSTGTKAVYLHASEALHGDAGIYSENDPVIFISKSGATQELLQLCRFFKTNKSKIISITCNKYSPLAKASDIVLDISIDSEADDFNLVPTASTTAALVMGDALALALMKAKKFTEKDFAKLHPAGQLGKNLTLTVKDVMHSINNLAKVTPDTNLKDVIIEMTKYNLGAACVVDDNNKLSGIITDGDVRRSLLTTDHINLLLAHDVMTKNPVTILPDATLKNSLDIMEQRNSQLSVLPVVENQILIGLLRIHDIYTK